MQSQGLKNGEGKMEWATRLIYFTKLKKEIAGGLVLRLQTIVQSTQILVRCSMVMVSTLEI